MHTLEGTQLGNYDVIRRIRVGGMGAVYEGRQRTAFGRRVAIKVILGDYARDREMRRRFAREARTIAQLHHPHILPLIEFGDEQGLLYLVMPFIEGGTLTSYLRRELPDFNDIETIFLQLLDAVEYAHEEGLIHRDIKSSNVLLDARRGGKPYVYLADFGLVRTSQNLELEETGKPIPLDQVPGTPHYMAPEQTRGIVTPATDIYALGVLLYQMLTGELPFDDPDDVEVVKMHLYAPSPSPCERDASIPYELGEVARRAMAKRPDQRFASVAEMRTAFRAAIQGSARRDTEDDPDIQVMDAPHRASLPLDRFETPAAPPGKPRPAPVKRRPAASMQAQTSAQAPRSRFARRPGRRFGLAVIAATMVPVLLLLIILVPRVLGISLFPANFPIVGASPSATITVTLKSQQLKDSYLLTASPEIAQPDVTTRVIPDRLLSTTLTAARRVGASGTQTIPGTRATGQLFFDNSSRQAVQVQSGMQFGASTGVQVIVTQSVTVPPRQDGSDGTVYAAAAAVVAGISGNIGSNVLNTFCCNNQVTVSNPLPFSGGADSQITHVVTQNDITGARNALIPGLQKQALQKIARQLAPDEVMAGQPVYITQVSSDHNAGDQADTVNVQVTIIASTTVYNTQTARQLAQQLLTKEAMQTLKGDFPNYRIKGQPVIASPVIISPGTKGVLYLSVQAQGLWVYAITQQQTDQWLQSIKGAKLALAQSYLQERPGVARIQIQLPFGADVLPTSVDQIQIVLANA